MIYSLQNKVGKNTLIVLTFNKFYSIKLRFTNFLNLNLMKRIFSILFVITLFFSCSSNDESDNPESQEENFYALTVGNSWVYKNYKYNPTTELYDDTGVIDSVSIIGTEDVSGETYFKFRRWTTGNEENITFCNPNGEHFELLRDSLGYLVRDSGSIKFVNNNNDEILISSQFFGNEYFQLQENQIQIVTESGSFECYDMLYFVRDQNDEILPGTNNYYYADGIGLIFDTTSWVSEEIHTVERRLDSYYVQ